MRCLATVVVLLCASSGITVLAPSPATADIFGPISLVSQSALPAVPPETSQQATYAHDTVISGDGRYVVFDGLFDGETGVWRRDLQSGEVQPVAVEDPADPALSAPDAELPSISEDGRYVSFTTTARLDATNDTNDDPDVYVRDMDKGLSEAGAFTLVSAVDGSTQGLSYESSGAYGAVASGRSALSADGSKVVFVTTAISNLAGPGTPPLQVAVRDLQSHQTRLVSVAYDPLTGRPAIDPVTKAEEPVSREEGGLTYGAVYAPSFPLPQYRAPAAYVLQSAIGASISADGSTVAWMGQDISEQARTLSGETLPAQYSEPLWRRIADGAQAPIRRVTGGSDPADPACAAGGERDLAEPLASPDPCQGPFKTEAPGIWTGGVGNPVPQLSADGSTVAFLAQAPPIGGTFGGDTLNLNSDLYVVDMAEGLTRVQALRPLTELASGNAQEQATTAPIVDLAISPDGSQLAFTTQRTVFPLDSPAYVSAPEAVPGMVELFEVDLSDETLTRVTHGFAGGAGEAAHSAETPGQDPYPEMDGALSPSFSANGVTLAFSSTAANLVYGDGNTPPQPNSTLFDGSDAFVVSRVLFGVTPTPQEVSPPPPSPALAPPWRLSATALSRKDGSVLLEIELPGAGTLRVGAQSAVRLRLLRARSRRGAGKARTRSARTRVSVATRTVATRVAHSGQGGLISVSLKPARSYAALAAERGGLSATAALTFSASGHRTLRESLAITFVREAHSSRASHRSGAAARGKRTAAGKRRR